jgi:hypothetical protein
MFGRCVALLVVQCLCVSVWASSADLRLIVGDPNLRALPGRPTAQELQILQSLYEGQNARLLWSVNGQPSQQARELANLLLTVETYGLRSDDYAADFITAECTRLSNLAPTLPEDWVRFDLLLS